VTRSVSTLPQISSVLPLVIPDKLFQFSAHQALPCREAGKLERKAFQIPLLMTSRRQRDPFLTITNFLYNIFVMVNLDAPFAALADPTRRAILAHLAKGEATVNELAEPFEMTQPAISRHLKVLEDAGLIVCRIQGTKRPRRLAKAGIEAMDKWLAVLRRALEANYDRLDEVLAGMETPNKGETL
jgi:DNA-binding transcriptional ArsR family regulator